MISMQLILLLVCIVGSAFYSGIETGVISINRIRLRHYINEGSRKALLLQNFLDHPDRLLGTTLLGTNLCNVVCSVVTASIAVQISATWGPTMSAALVTVVLLIFGEYLPKAWFQAQPLARCARFTVPLYVSWLVMRPVVIALTWTSRLLVRGSGSAVGGDATFVTKDELKVLAHEVETGGMLSTRERVMIHSVMELSRKTARQIMIPRDKMVSIEKDASIDRLFEVAHASGHTRLPVYDGEAERFIGVINVFDVVSVDTLPTDAVVEDFMRNPLIITELMPIDDMLPRLRAGRQRLCLIRSRESEIIGLVTTEDILAEIVGEL